MPRTTSPHRPALKWVRVVSALFGAVLLTALPASVSVASPPPSPTAMPSAEPNGGEAVTLPTMKAWTWIVVDADSGDVLGGRDWHWQLPPASTLKTLTALALVNRLQLDSEYRVRKQDTQAEGSKVGLKEGSSYRVRDLYDGMLMPSGNDAAAALASAYGGKEAATQAMSAEANRLGAKDTVVKNTSGLDDPGQVSSAYDLALIMRESLKNPVLRDIYKQHHVEFPDVEPTDPGTPRKTVRIWTENRFILNDYPGALGGKTGFTSQAGRTYVGAMERDGRTLIVAIMRSAESTERAVSRLFDWGFANHDKLNPVDHLADPEPEDESTPIPAATYDGAGNASTPQVAVEESTSGGPNPPILLFIGLAVVALGAFIWRRRNSGSPDVDLSDTNSEQVDLRERDGSPRL